MQRLAATKFFFACFCLCLFASFNTLNINAAAAENSAKQQPPAKQPVSAAKAKADDEDDSKDDEQSDSEDEQAEDVKKDDDTSNEDDKKEEKKDDDKDKTSDKKEAKAEAKKDDKKEKKADKTKKKAPKPFTVKTGKIKVEAELAGIFVADEMEEVELRPEVWAKFKVLEAVAHGTHVKQGDVLVRFDDEKLLESIAKESLNQNISQLAMLQAEEDYPRNKRKLEIQFETATRQYEQMVADYEYYQKTDRPTSVRLTHFRYKSAAEALATAQEELDQLLQMYEADEITEETEEIVLRRQRFAVETAKLVLELNKESRDRTLNVTMKRSDEQYATRMESAEIAYKQAKTAYTMGMTRMNYDMEKKRNSRAESVERHGKLLSDKGLMTLRAPCDGVVYYGKCNDGKWGQISSMKAKLKLNGSVSPNSVVMTIVKPGSMHIESVLSEKQFAEVQAGMEATIVPAADSELKLDGEIASIESTPSASNKFGASLSVDLEKAPQWLVAGLTCKAKVLVYENKEALIIPQVLVETDEENENVKYVMLLDDEGEPTRRKVKLGRKQSKSKSVEVLKGLEAGDKIVKEEKDKEKKSGK